MNAQAKPTDSEEVKSLKEAAEMFVAKKDGANTRRTYRNGVGHFLSWLKDQGVTRTFELGREHASQYPEWVKGKVERGEWAARTARTYSGVAREFVHFLERVFGVEYGMHDLVERYKVPEREQKAELKISPERARAVVDYHRDHFPHSRETVIIWILFHTGMRMGCGLRGIDVDDVFRKEDGTPVINVADRPEYEDGTKHPSHDRYVPISEELYREIKRYIEHKRIPCEEPNERRPLLTTQYHGRGRRVSDKTIQATVYRATCPRTTGITIDGDCSCEPPVSRKTASKCEKSISPHQFRSVRVILFKDEGHSYEDLEPYLGATPDVLRQTYDKADKDRRLERAKKLH